MTVGTLVIIVMALILLVILVLGFTTGWKNLWDRITTFGGGENDIQTAIEACQISCAKQSEYEFCNRNLKVIDEDDADGDGSVKDTISVKCPDLYAKGLPQCDFFGDCKSS
jgi:hypothetical protein